MDWVEDIQKVVDYIEDHLDESIEINSLAKQLFVSSHQFQKMFSILCECTVGEYIRNRKLTLAGYDLLSSDEKVIDIAIKYGYDTHESFTRAFTRFHDATPSAIRKNLSTINTFSRITVKGQITEGKIMVNDLNKRGYVVKETGAVYYTKDMDKTVKWFKEVLGWYGQINSRDNVSQGVYGCVNNIPMEIEALHIAPFTGIHLFQGEPIKRLIGFMLVKGIDELHEYVIKSSWKQITSVVEEEWGGVVEPEKLQL